MYPSTQYVSPTATAATVLLDDTIPIMKKNIEAIDFIMVLLCRTEVIVVVLSMLCFQGSLFSLFPTNPSRDGIYCTMRTAVFCLCMKKHFQIEK
jgi:hypothetical protein